MTAPLTDLQAEALRARLEAFGWSFLGGVGEHRYWLRPGGGWRPETEAFVWVQEQEVPEESPY